MAGHRRYACPVVTQTRLPAVPRYRSSRYWGSCGRRGGLRAGPMSRFRRVPAADDVTHGQPPGYVVVFDHHEVPEPALDHGCGGFLQGPVGRGEGEVFGAVLS